MYWYILIADILVLLNNKYLRQKRLALTNTQAYYTKELITIVKSFTVYAPYFMSSTNIFPFLKRAIAYYFTAISYNRKNFYVTGSWQLNLTKDFFAKFFLNVGAVFDEKLSNSFYWQTSGADPTKLSAMYCSKLARLSLNA